MISNNCVSDFKVEHDPSGLCDGVDSPWEEVFKRSENGSAGGGCWCGSLYSH